jgi:hypothetical protein
MEDAGYGEKHTNRENISVIIGAEGGNDLPTAIVSEDIINRSSENFMKK